MFWRRENLEPAVIFTPDHPTYGVVSTLTMLSSVLDLGCIKIAVLAWHLTTVHIVRFGVKVFHCWMCMAGHHVHHTFRRAVV